ncbi:hypothetical protein Leryth_007748 [Lithospermum erythrorhizon]|nr:hypothetical protein Leryth_007748 [Lithospermum erythrorhizon]
MQFCHVIIRSDCQHRGIVNRLAVYFASVKKLQRACLRDPVKIEAASKYSTVDTLKQQYAFVPAKHKVCFLLRQVGMGLIMVASPSLSKPNYLEPLGEVRNNPLPSPRADFIVFNGCHHVRLFFLCTTLSLLIFGLISM